MKSFESLRLKNKLKDKIAQNFPSSEIKYSFAYGSAVIPQKNYTGIMIDIFFVVEDLKKFHTLNLKKNYNHYSTIARNLSTETLVSINRSGSGVYYNPSVLINNDMCIKYGVVAEKDFIYHLTNWDNLFIAGRLHKPILSITSDSHVEDIIKKNRASAFSLCILMNKPKISKVEFFIHLANLSYIGDIRTYLKAEKKDKIKNVVLGALDYYTEIYSECIDKYNISSDPDIFEFAPELNIRHLNNLPKHFLNSFIMYQNEFDQDEFIFNFARNMTHDQRNIILSAYLEKMNFKYSSLGILSGLYSTDLNKSFSYVLEKYKKALSIV